MFLIDAIKPNKEHFFFFFMQLFSERESEEYKIKQVLFLYVLSFWCQPKNIIQKYQENIF